MPKSRFNWERGTKMACLKIDLKYPRFLALPKIVVDILHSTLQKLITQYERENYKQYEPPKEKNHELATYVVPEPDGEENQ